ncbi:MAG: UDP-N-acetylglucosamine 1-carboxyvinyltransferase [Alphaproteobacteria bacterium]
MDKIEIIGGLPLKGRIKISGAKNSALPIMAACLLTEKKISISNVPELSDINSMIKLLESLNVKIKKKEKKLELNSFKPSSLVASYELVRKMRASFLILGPLIARYGSASVSMPGGCAIGTRPVDLHLEGLKKMGVRFKIDSGYVTGKIDGRLRGATINLDQISVGATENIIMAATLAEGKTVINNAAREPEVIDLSLMLIKMGADIKGYGTKKISIIGQKSLAGCNHEIMPDRIESGTFALCVFGCSGKIQLDNLNKDVCNHLKKIFKKLKSLNFETINNGNSLIVSKNKNIEISLTVRTAEYPGFPTDLQAQLTSSLLKTRGKNEIVENIFENRFMHISELIRMGAKLKLNGSKVIVSGTEKLVGAEVMATDLRASSSLIIAGLMAKGKTTINRVYHLDRGYENIEEKLKLCGAQIERLKE